MLSRESIDGAKNLSDDELNNSIYEFLDEDWKLEAEIYPYSLDTMATVEKFIGLDDKRADKYISCLHSILLRDLKGEHSYICDFDVATATARQRAEASWLLARWDNE